MDTRTREILCAGFRKFTAIATDKFSLLLLRDGFDQARINSVLASLENFGMANSTSYPFVKRQETLHDRNHVIASGRFTFWNG